jgi:hypothetical protein
MIYPTSRANLIVGSIAALVAAQSAPAANIYWDGVSRKGWDDVKNWSTTTVSTTTNPSAVPGG